MGVSALVAGAEEGVCEPWPKEKAGVVVDPDDDAVVVDGNEKAGLAAASPGAGAPGLKRLGAAGGCEGPDCDV